MLDAAVRCAVPGARAICFVEREAPAAAILAARMADGSLCEAPIWSDIGTFDGKPWRGRVDGIIGGFPCTDLSVAGRQAGLDGDASGLFFEYVRIIREVHPRWVFIENVPPVLSFPTGGTVLGELAALGFDAEWGTVRASDVGAPHRRDRAFILAHATQRGLGELREPSGRGGLADGCVAAVGYAECSRWAEAGSGRAFDAGRELKPGRCDMDNTASPRCVWRKPGEGWQVWDEARRGEPCGRCDAMENPRCPERRPHDERGGCGGERCDGQREAAGGVGESGLPLFPPGPADADAWQRILAERPDLAPAVESGVRGLADGCSRVDRLRAGGNGVVVLQASAAFSVLARRAGLRF